MRPVTVLLAILLACAVIAAAFFSGASWRERSFLVSTQHDQAKDPADKYPGRYYKFNATDDGLGELDESVEQLAALGYLGGTIEAPQSEGVTVNDPAQTYGSLNVYTSGHAPEAYLMNMAGQVLHTWTYSFEELWPDYRGPSANTSFWRRVSVLENGDILAIFEPIGIFKLDKDSNLIWKNQCGAHHAIDVLDDGTIYTLTHHNREVNWFSEGEPVFDDSIAVLSQDGELLREVSLLKCLRDSFYNATLRGAEKAGDVLHANAIRHLDGSQAHISPFFARGNVLVSLRELDLVVIVDMEKESVVWATSGMWRRQHDPSLLDTGNILIFDNRGNDGRSKVIEFNPLTKEPVWTYGLAGNEPLLSVTCGTVARLPNGNTLITESNNGRALEVTQDNSIVWEFINPHRAGEREEFIATVFDMMRLPEGFQTAWLPRLQPDADN